MALLGTVIGAGEASARPAAATANAGYLWLSTDTGGGTLYRSNGSDWVQVAAGVSAGSSSHGAVTLAADADTLLSLSTQEIGLDVQNANEVFAGPTSGADADPAFRALVAADLPAAVRTRSVNIVLDGGSSAITTGVKGDVEFPVACTITAWRLLADQDGAIKVDLWADSYANYPPTDADSICGGHEPEIAASAAKAEDTDLADWSGEALAAGSILRVNVDSCTTITRCTLSLTVTL